MSTETLDRPKTGKTTLASKGKREPVPKKRLETQIQTVSEDTRQKLISEAAYFKSMNRNFAQGYEQEDWLEAEQEIDNQLASTSKESAAKQD